MKTHSRVAAGAATCLLALLGMLAANEYWYFYPLTPLFLDTGDRVRLPDAKGRARLLFVGDVLLGDAAADTLAAKGYDYPSAATRSLIAGADLAIGNLEGPISTVGTLAKGKRWAYRAGPESARALSRAGFDLMDLGNNHIRDCGDAGILESIAYLDQAGIVSFGGGLTEEQAHRTAIARARGVSIAFLGYTAPYVMLEGRKVSLRNLAWGKGHGGAAWGDIEHIQRDIARAKDKADMVIVSLHMGDRYQPRPEEFERDLCRQIIDAGADAVIGHGTHIMGPIELYRGKPIFYSIGNFAFGSRNLRARFSLMAFLEIDLARRGLYSLYALPIYTNNLSPWIWFQPKVVTGWEARRVLGDLAQMSRSYGTALSLESDPWRASLKPK